MGGINLSFFMKKIIIFLIFSHLLIIPPTAKAAVIINEIAWMGTENSANDEWIELHADQQTSLDGWIIESADGTPTINLEGNISANSYFLLERTDDNSVPDISADQVYTGALSNSGEHLKLKDNNSSLVDEIDCSQEWIAGDNSTKQTMERVGNQWQASAYPGGTPKSQNSGGEKLEDPQSSSQEKEILETETENQPPIAKAGNNLIGFVNQAITLNASSSYDPNNNSLSYQWNLGDGEIKNQAVIEYKYSYPGEYLAHLTVSDGSYTDTDTVKIKIYPKQITINEFIPDPEGKDSEQEWIEIYNNLDQAIDLSGWFLDDEPDGSTPFAIPENSLIPSKGYLVFSRKITKIALNNDGDQVRLLLPDKTIFQEISYEESKQGKSLAKSPKGFVWSIPTPGFSNVSGIEEYKNNYQESVQLASATKQSDQKNSSEKDDPEQKYYNLADLEKSTNSNSKLILTILTVIVGIIVITLGILKLRKKN